MNAESRVVLFALLSADYCCTYMWRRWRGVANCDTGGKLAKTTPSKCVLSVLQGPCTERQTHRGAMGCGLRKMKPTSEETSPGKIYSTLKRPQVETKVGVAYTYRYLDFLIGKDGKSL